MNKLTKFALVAVSFATAIPFVNAAGTNAATPANPTAATPAAHPRLRARLARRAAFAHHLAKKLDLNKDQVAQLKTIRSNTRTSLKALHHDASLTPDQKKTKARELVANARTQARAVLTPEQQAKLKQIKAHLQQRFGAL